MNNEGNSWTYIKHRKISQSKSGRRLLVLRRSLDVLHDPERRDGKERRVLADRRKSLD